jgi:hypothetical protein
VVLSYPSETIVGGMTVTGSITVGYAEESPVQISSIGQTDITLFGQTSKSGQYFSAAWGDLTKSDVDLIRKVTGQQDFTWPPDETKGYPPMAIDLATWRRQERLAGNPLTDLNSADISKLRQLGILTAEMADSAKAVLNHTTTEAATTTATAGLDRTLSIDL